VFICYKCLNQLEFGIQRLSFSSSKNLCIISWAHKRIFSSKYQLSSLLLKGPCSFNAILRDSPFLGSNRFNLARWLSPFDALRAARWSATNGTPILDSCKPTIPKVTRLTVWICADTAVVVCCFLMWTWSKSFYLITQFPNDNRYFWTCFRSP